MLMSPDAVARNGQPEPAGAMETPIRQVTLRPISTSPVGSLGAGNGAIDALMRAVDNALAPLLGDGVVLATYDVDADGAGHESSATISVGVRRRDDPSGPLHPGRAAHENVLEASVVAYIDAVNALLADEGVDIASAVPTPGATARHDADSDQRSLATDRIMSVYDG